MLNWFRKAGAADHDDGGDDADHPVQSFAVISRMNDLESKEPFNYVHYPASEYEPLVITDEERDLYLAFMSSLDTVPSLPLWADSPPEIPDVRVGVEPITPPDVPYPRSPILPAKHLVSLNPSRYALVSLVSDAGVRLCGFPAAAVRAADEALAGWHLGVVARSCDPTQLVDSDTPIVYRIALRGKAWQKKGNQELESIRLILTLLTALGRHGWSMAGDIAAMSKIDAHNLLFAAKPNPPPAPLFFAVTMPLPDRISLVSPPKPASAAIISGVRQCLSNFADIKTEGWIHAGVYRFWLAGLRRLGGTVKRDQVSKMQPPMVIGIINILNKLNFEFVKSIPLSSTAGRDVFIFCSTPESGLSARDAFGTEGLLDTATSDAIAAVVPFSGLGATETTPTKSRGRAMSVPDVHALSTPRTNDRRLVTPTTTSTATNQTGATIYHTPPVTPGSSAPLIRRSSLEVWDRSTSAQQRPLRRVESAGNLAASVHSNSSVSLPFPLGMGMGPAHPAVARAASQSSKASSYSGKSRASQHSGHSSSHSHSGFSHRSSSLSRGNSHRGLPIGTVLLLPGGQTQTMSVDRSDRSHRDSKDRETPIDPELRTPGSPMPLGLGPPPRPSPRKSSSSNMSAQAQPPQQYPLDLPSVIGLEHQDFKDMGNTAPLVPHINDYSPSRPRHQQHGRSVSSPASGSAIPSEAWGAARLSPKPSTTQDVNAASTLGANTLAPSPADSSRRNSGAPGTPSTPGVVHMVSGSGTGSSSTSLSSLAFPTPTIRPRSSELEDGRVRFPSVVLGNVITGSAINSINNNNDLSRHTSRQVSMGSIASTSSTERPLPGLPGTGTGTWTPPIPHRSPARTASPPLTLAHPPLPARSPGRTASGAKSPTLPPMPLPQGSLLHDVLRGSGGGVGGSASTTSLLSKDGAGAGAGAGASVNASVSARADKGPRTLSHRASLAGSEFSFKTTTSTASSRPPGVGSGRTRVKLSFPESGK